MAGAVAMAGHTSAIEQVSYRVEAADGRFEVRDYPSTVVAEVVRPGDRDATVSAAFRALADYIFANDRAGAKIPMTAPVIQTPEVPAEKPPATGADRWAVRFVMPGGSTIASLPAANGDVRLVETPPLRVAAVRFSGRWTDRNFADAEASLRAWMATRDLEAAGPPLLAYYDPPFKPPFLRRNEVLIPLRELSDG